MSDVLIKGMEMPETCKLCYLSEFDPGFYAYVCKPTGIRIDYDMAKVDRPRTICPLVPVPPHGKLIDADSLVNELVHSEFFSMSDYNNFVGLVLKAPTIIPAEPSEEQREYEAQVEAAQYCEMYEPSYDPETGAL